MSGAALATVTDITSLVATKAAVDPPAGVVDDPATDPAQLRALVLSLSDAIEQVRQIEQDTARRLADEAYQRGLREGYERGARAYEADWRAVVAPIVASVAARPTVAELETRRWGDGGREHYARPMPGDHGPWTADDIAALKQRWERWAAGGDF